MNPRENPNSHLQITLPEIIRNISTHFKINPETVTKVIQSKGSQIKKKLFFHQNDGSFDYENGDLCFCCYENGQMNNLESFVEAVISYCSTEIEIEKLKMQVVQFTITLLKNRKSEIEKLEKKIKKDER